MRPTIGKPDVRIPEHAVRRPQWWVGAMTVAALIIVSAGLAMLVQTAMWYRSDDIPKTVNDFFFFFGFPGVVAESIANGGSRANTIGLHENHEAISVVVNTIVYTAIMLLRLFFQDKPQRRTKPPTGYDNL